MMVARCAIVTGEEIPLRVRRITDQPLGSSDLSRPVKGAGEARNGPLRADCQRLNDSLEDPHEHPEDHPVRHRDRHRRDGGHRQRQHHDDPCRHQQQGDRHGRRLPRRRRRRRPLQGRRPGDPGRHGLVVRSGHGALLPGPARARPQARADRWHRGRADRRQQRVVHHRPLGRPGGFHRPGRSQDHDRSPRRRGPLPPVGGREVAGAVRGHGRWRAPRSPDRLGFRSQHPGVEEARRQAPPRCRRDLPAPAGQGRALEGDRQRARLRRLRPARHRVGQGHDRLRWRRRQRREVAARRRAVRRLRLLRPRVDRPALHALLARPPPRSPPIDDGGR